MAADKAVILELLGGPYNKGEVVNYTVAAGTSISKGDILQLTDPHTASLCTAYTQPLAGIAASDKDGSDTSTTLGVYKHGHFDLKCSGAAITAGDLVHCSGNNLIAAVPSTTTLASGNIVLGVAEETASAGTAEIIRVLVNL